MGPKRMLIFAHIVLIVRLLIYMYLPFSFPHIFENGANIMIVFVELTHGLAFGLYWSAGLQHIQNIAPKDFTQTFLGIFCSLSNNAGGILGTIGGGFVYENYGYFYLWLNCLVLMMLSCALFTVSIYISNR